MIIAELCQNHEGDLDVLKSMVFQSANAGAWACKIQSFFADDLTYEFKHDYDRMKRLELSWEAHGQFVDWCKEAGVVPMTSVYTTDHVGKLSDLGFKWVKIGSSNSHNKGLAAHYKLSGFKVIISTGGRDLRKIPKFYPLEGVLHCVSKYPHSPYEANLLRMLEIKHSWPKSACGFSDHTDPTHREWFLPSYMASYLGASYIEKHITLLGYNDTKDGPVSINMMKLKQICEFDGLTQDKKAEQLERKGSFLVLKKATIEGEKELIAKYQNRWRQN